MPATVIEISVASGTASSTGMSRASSGTAIKASPKPNADRITVATKTIARTSKSEAWKMCIRDSIQKGFDFLGQNIRKYGRKLLITPAQKNVQAVLTKIRGIIEKNKSATQENLIVQLNPVIRGWANYHRHCVAKRAFSRMDFEIWRKLWLSLIHI